MAQGSSTSPYDDSRQQRIEAFVREAEAFLASRGGLDPGAVPALAYQFGLNRDEFQEAMYQVYSSPPGAPRNASPDKPSPSSSQPPQPTVATPPPSQPQVAEQPPARSTDDELFPPEVLAENVAASTMLEDSNSADETLAPSELIGEYEFPGIRPQDLYHFVRQARLVLADERGWNERSLARLNFLADQLLIPHAVRSTLFRKLDDPNFAPPVPTDKAPAESDDTHSADVLAQPIEAVPSAAQEEEEEARQKEERRKRHSPSRLYTHYLKKALEALPTQRVNQRREEKLIREGTEKLGLSEVLARDLLLEVAQDKGYVLLSELQKTEKPSNQPAAEELLVDFQQRAAAIIAGQGGVNSLTRIMIAQVALDLGLSDEQRDAALASIQRQTEKNEVDTRLQQRAGSFREFVRTKLEVIAHGIVIASLAQKLVQIGVDMHGIDEELAWHTLREVLQEEDLRLVTVEQAKSHVSVLVGDILLEEQFLSIQNRQRLMAEGAQWGLTPGRCEQLIDQRVGEFTRKKRRTQRQVALIFTAFFTLLVGGGFYILYLDTKSPKEPPTLTNSPTTLPAVDSPNAVATETESPHGVSPKPVWQRQPWWSEKLSLALLDIYQQEPSLQESLTVICTNDETNRIKAYRELIPQLVTTSIAHPAEDLQSKIRDALVGLVRDEPSDEAVAAIAEALTSNASPPDVASNSQPARHLEKAYLSVLAADQTALPEVRKKAFLDKIGQQLGITFSGSSDPLELTINEIVRDQYFKLNELLKSDPKLAAVQHAAVSQASKNYLPPEQVTDKDGQVAAAILAHLTGDWKAYQPTVQAVIDSPNSAQILPLLTSFSQQLPDANIQQELAQMLSQRIGRSLDANNPAQSAALVRTELGLDSIAASDGERQREFSQLASQYAWEVPSDIPPNTLVNEVAALGYLSVLGHALDKGDMGRRIFEEMSGQGIPELEDDSTNGKTVSTAANAALSKIEALISRLSQARNPISRVDNYRELCVLAGDVNDVDYETASLLAQYILAPKPRAEQSQLQLGFRAFSHWTTFKLALADQLPEARRPADDLQEIVSALLGETVSFVEVRTARTDLRNILLLRALDSLGNQSFSPDHFSAKVANDTASRLVDYYRRHAQLEGISNEQLAGIELPDAIADILIETEQKRLRDMTLSENETAQLQDITRQKIALDYLGNSPIASMAVRQRVWLKLLALRLGKERPQLNAPLKQLLEQLENQDANAANLFVQLRNGEMALIKFWELSGGAV